MRNLLVVEDNPNTLSGLVTLLGDEGYDVDGVMQGTEALAIAEEKPIDMVLCDFNLPDTNGLQVCQRLRKINPEAIFFLTTAQDSTALTDSAYEYGVKRIFQKPIDMDDLFDTLLGFSKKLV